MCKKGLLLRSLRRYSAVGKSPKRLLQPSLLKANLWRIFRPSRKASITCGQCRLSSNILGLWWFVMRTLLWTSRFGRSNTSKSYGMFIALLTRRPLQTLTLMEQHQLLRPEINLLFLLWYFYVLVVLQCCQPLWEELELIGKFGVILKVRS